MQPFKAKFTVTKSYNRHNDIHNIPPEFEGTVVNITSSGFAGNLVWFLNEENKLMKTNYVYFDIVKNDL